MSFRKLYGTHVPAARLASLVLILAIGHSAASSSVVLAQEVRTAAPSLTTDPWDFRFDLFQLLFEEQGLVESLQFDAAFEQPQQSVIVIIDPPVRSSFPWPAIHRFVQEGGSLLLASDNASNVPSIGRFMTGPVVSTDPASRYRVFADCVRVSDVSNLQGQFDGVLSVITNRSTWFLPDARGTYAWEPLARFPRNCLPQAAQGKPLLAVGQISSESLGVVVVSADASLFSNGMLWHGDNAVLAIRVSTLLARGDKSRLVFNANGNSLGSARDRLPKNPASDLAPPVVPPINLPEPTMDQMLRLANAVAKEVVDSNVLNETLKQQPRNVRPIRYFRAILLVFFSLLVMWLLIKLASSGGFRGIVLRRRRMRSAYELGSVTGNDVATLRQSAGYLAREFCWELTGSRQSADWQKFAARLLLLSPTVGSSDARDLNRVFDMASRGCREPLTAFDFQKLGKTIAALREKHRRGELLGVAPIVQ